LEEQLENVDWATVSDRSLVDSFCLGCVVKRFLEVSFIKRFLQEADAKFAIFEPEHDTWLEKNSEVI
jgi:hypothetical protein